MKIENSGGVIINETGVDADFRVESALSTAALFMRGSDGNTGIGHTDPDNKLSVLESLAKTTVVIVNSHASAPIGILVDFVASTPDDNTQSFLRCLDNTTDRCFIFSDGDLQNHDNSYGGISDERLKENIVDATPKLADLMDVKVRNYNFITDGPEGKHIGVIAQELEAVFPGLVHNHPALESELNADGDVTIRGYDEYKSVQYSLFVPMLIKGMQEQQVIIDEKSNKIEVLESAMLGVLARLDALEGA